MTACWTRTNTNLGIVLLLAPLAKAAMTAGSGDLRHALRHVLERDDGQGRAGGVCGDSPRTSGWSGTVRHAGRRRRTGRDAARGDASRCRSRRHRARVCDGVRRDVRARRAGAGSCARRRPVVERRDRRDLLRCWRTPSTRISSAGQAWPRPSACRCWRGKHSRPAACDRPRAGRLSRRWTGRCAMPVTRTIPARRRT